MTIYAVNDWEEVPTQPFYTGNVYEAFLAACEDGGIPSYMRYYISPSTGRTACYNYVSIGAIQFALGLKLIEDEV